MVGALTMWFRVSGLGLGLRCEASGCIDDRVMHKMTPRSSDTARH